MRMEMFKKSILKRIREGKGLDYISILPQDNDPTEYYEDILDENDDISITANNDPMTPTISVLRSDNERNIEMSNPLFCNDKCSDCTVLPKFKQMLMNGLKPNQTEINHELGLHNHPKSRKYNKNLQSKYGMQRLADQAREELLNHYNYCH